MFPRHRTGNSTVEAESTKNGCKPITAEICGGGKALFEMLALKPERGKPAFRNFREGDGNGGIIRSPLRAIALPDSREIFKNQSADAVHDGGRQYEGMRNREHPLGPARSETPTCMETPRARSGRLYQRPTRRCARAGWRR